MLYNIEKAYNKFVHYFVYDRFKKNKNVAFLILLSELYQSTF